MGAYDELRTNGQLGSAGVRQLYRTVAAVARRRGFPPPVGHASWSSDAVMEEAHDFLTGTKGMGRIHQLYVKATDEDSFAALLNVAVLNHFRSRARKTAVGRLVRRLNDLLSEDGRFVRSDGRWRLAASEDGLASIIRDEELEAAAWRVDVDIVRYRPDAKHQSLGAAGNDLIRLAEAVLETAGASLDEGHLARVIGSRLGLRELPLATSLDAGDLSGRDEPTAVDDSPAFALAAGLWTELEADERDVLGGYDLTVDELGRLLGASPSSAHRSRKRLEEALRIKMIDVDDADDVWRALRDIAERHRQRSQENPSSSGTT